ncbi:MAG: signal peptidase I [Clostridiaceae bacterium]|nr:signal peptidase I [Clostridiaceae bacterium]
MKINHVKEIKVLIFQIIIAVLAAFFIVEFLGRIVIVEGSSMQPTLSDNDVLIVEKLTQRFGKIKQGDIVVLKIPELLENKRRYVIKRVIATQGQHIKIEEGKVWVDGNLLQENYINGDRTIIENSVYDDIIVPEGCVYVLGDNRLPGKSRDSRVFGLVNTDRIVGKSWIRIFPLNRTGIVR